jgi:hypothetical protein
MSGRCKEVRMASKKTPADRERQDQVVAEARRYQAQREQSYRAQALKLYPWICARWVAYLLAADNVSRPLLCHLREVNQPVIHIPN